VGHFATILILGNAGIYAAFELQGTCCPSWTIDPALLSRRSWQRQ